MIKPIDHYDGDSGALLLTMPKRCALDCSTPGQPADESVAYWLPRVVWHASEEVLRRSLWGYGAWDDLDTAEIDTIKGRVLWLAAGDWRENHGR